MIPLVNLKLQYKLHRSALEKTLLKIGASAEYILGPEVTRFEKRFANFIKVKHAVGVASGTDALRLSCLALGIGLGDEVLVPANTFIATALAVHSTGATPVPIDIHSDTFLLDIKEAEKRISPRTKAIIPVHFGGHPCDMDNITKIANNYNLRIIEDLVGENNIFAHFESQGDCSTSCRLISRIAIPSVHSLTGLIC